MERSKSLHCPYYDINGHIIPRKWHSRWYTIHMPSGCIGTTCPPLAAVGVNVCQRSLNRTSRGRPPYMYCWNLAAIPRLLQLRRNLLKKGTHLWPSLPQRPAQTAPHRRPWIACHQIRSPQAQLDLWSRIARPNLHLLLTMGAAETASSTHRSTLKAIRNSHCEP